VIQKAWIRVDEEGTEAHAETVISMVLGAHPPKEAKFRMVVDRPFFYMIRDDRTCMILFMGVTVDPTAGSEYKPKGRGFLATLRNALRRM
jgi:serpin B